VTSSLVYVYCLVLSERRPAIPARIDAVGVPGGRETRALAVGDHLWLIITTVPAADYDQASLATGLQDLDWVGRRALAHEGVVEQFLTTKAVLPMQLFTLFTSEERAVQHVARQRQEIRAIIRRLERKLEWGLRLTFDEKAVRDSIDARWSSAPASGALRSAPTEPASSSGASYLARKRDLLDVNRVQLRAARAEADRLFAALTKEAADARRRTETEQAAPGSRLLLDAAFLVPTSRTRSFRASVARRAKQIGAAGVAVSLTGPWPAYNFIAPAERTKRPSARTRGKHTH
jgi:hypothetical protein